MQFGQVGRYRLVRRLGRGGMAEVFEAVAEGASGFERRVAFKRMLPCEDSEGSLGRMFLDEARIASQLHHANIVPVLDYGVVDGLPFQVLEFVDGLDAGKIHREAADRGVEIPEALILHIGRETAHALHHAHDATDASGETLGVVHRDVSPANILLSWSGDVRLTDFGIAFAKNRSERTSTGMTKGTLMYSAPEQTTGGSVDRRTDVFSLGAVLHRLLVGHSPLRGENALADLLAGRPLALDPSLSEDVAEILERALRRDRRERFESAAVMAEQLAKVIASRGVVDARGGLRDFMGSLREEKPAPAGRLDAFLGLEIVAPDPSVDPSGDTEHARTFISTPSSAAAKDEQTPSVIEPEPTAVSTTTAKRRTPWALPAGLAAGIAAVGAALWLRPGSEPVETTTELAGAATPEPEPAKPEPAPALDDKGETKTTTADPPPAAEPDPAPVSPVVAKPSTKTRRDRHTQPTAVDKKKPPPPAEPSLTTYVQIGGKGALQTKIVVDGEARGYAPRRLELPAGPHEVVLHDADGVEVARKTIRLNAGHTQTSPLRWIVQ